MKKIRAFFNQLFGGLQCLHCGSWDTRKISYAGEYNFGLQMEIKHWEYHVCYCCDKGMYVQIKKDGK